MFYWLMKFVFLGPLLHALFRPKAVGPENVPVEGPALIAANHVSPAQAIRPASGRRSPATQRRTVVLPAPDGPASATTSWPPRTAR